MKKLLPLIVIVFLCLPLAQAFKFAGPMGVDAAKSKYSCGQGVNICVGIQFSEAEQVSVTVKDETGTELTDWSGAKQVPAGNNGNVLVVMREKPDKPNYQYVVAEPGGGTFTKTVGQKNFKPYSAGSGGSDKKLVFRVAFHTRIVLAGPYSEPINAIPTHWFTVRSETMAPGKIMATKNWQPYDLYKKTDEDNGHWISQYRNVVQADFSVYDFSDPNNPICKQKSEPIDSLDISHTGRFSYGGPEPGTKVYGLGGKVYDASGADALASSDGFAFDKVACPIDGVKYYPVLYGQLVKNRNPNADSFIALLYAIQKEVGTTAQPPEIPGGGNNLMDKFGNG